ncbi:glycerol dehydrogenase [Enterococcus larvae]|uniref:glycerol dehydrogenase n=1 Tax=Enterococcus larvae TaxID=2794352 RepID=UPI003F2E824C
MEKVFASPSRYVQGKDVLKTGLTHIEDLGEKTLLLCDDVVWGIVGEQLYENLKKADFEVTHVPFNGEASSKEIDRVSEIGKEHSCDVVLGLGGGKTIDAAKAISDQLGIAVAVLPTVASTDAPTSALSVIYSEDGVFEKYRFYAKNPELVLVDTKVISQAPTRLLASGIADALATWVEVSAVIKAKGTTMAKGYSTLAAAAIAEKCEATLFSFGLQAIEANRSKVVTEALEAVVEANTLLSGIGFESGGLAAAHAIHNGFTALEGPVHEKTHGEKVAYGTLTQLVLENKPKELLDKYIYFYQVLGLPTTLADLELSGITYEELLMVGKQATIESETIHQMAGTYTAEDVTDALFAVDAYVNSLKK